MSFDTKDIVQVIVQAGAVGLCYLLIKEVGRKIDRLHDAIYHLASKIVDHRARAGDPHTPPHLGKV